MLPSKRMPDIQESETLANENEEYSVNVPLSTIKIEKVATRKDFKSKYFGRAETVCCTATAIIIILLLSVWIFYESKEADV